MYCLYESINKHNADIDFFVATCVSYVFRPKPKESVKNWWRNNTLKFGHKTQKMSITSKIPEISKIPYKQKCLRIRYYTQYWNFPHMWTHKVHAPINRIPIGTTA